MHLNWLRYTLAFTEREYVLSRVNMLTKSLKISDPTTTEFFHLTAFQSDQKIWQRYCLADLGSLADHITF